MNDTFKRKVFRVELLAVDSDGVGEKGVRDYLENLRHLSAQVMAIEGREVDWHDGHPLNNSEAAPAEFARMFARATLPTAAPGVDDRKPWEIPGPNQTNPPLPRDLDPSVPRGEGNSTAGVGPSDGGGNG